MEEDFDVKDVIVFLMAAKEAGESHGTNVPFEFTCTSCGKQAEAAVAGVNGHVHAHCRHCGMNVAQ